MGKNLILCLICQSLGPLLHRGSTGESWLKDSTDLDHWLSFLSQVGDDIILRCRFCEYARSVQSPTVSLTVCIRCVLVYFERNEGGCSFSSIRKQATYREQRTFHYRFILLSITLQNYHLNGGFSLGDVRASREVSVSLTYKCRETNNLGNLFSSYSYIWRYGNFFTLKMQCSHPKAAKQRW